MHCLESKRFKSTCGAVGGHGRYVRTKSEEYEVAKKGRAISIKISMFS